MKNFITYLLTSLSGGVAYCALELLWRGRTHYSMFFAAAAVSAIFLYINSSYKMNFWLKSLCGALIITAAELLFGLIFNIILNRHIWDYSSVFLNFKGQICAPYFVVWFLLSAVAFKVMDLVKNRAEAKTERRKAGK